MARVLLLEEDATYAEELVRGLSSAAYDVTLVREGNAGLALATEESFDALIVSAELPGINGFRLCTRLRKKASFTSSIVLMGSSRTVGFDEHPKLASRADGYLRKPVVLGELLAMLDQLKGKGPGSPPRPRSIPPRAPSARPPARSGGGRALASALDKADAQAAAVADLRKRLAEQENLVGSLSKELASAKKAKPPPLPGKPVGPSPADVAPLREQLLKKEKELVETRSALDAERHKGIDQRNELAEREALVRSRDAELRELAARLERAEKLSETATSNRADASKRENELSRALEKERTSAAKMRSDLEALRGERQKSATSLEAEVAGWKDKARAAEQSLEATSAEMAKAKAEARQEAERARLEEKRARERADKADASAAELARAKDEVARALESEREGRVAAEQAARAAREEGEANERVRLAEGEEWSRKLAAATRAAQEAQKGRADLEASQSKRLSALRAHHEAERTKLVEEARALRVSEQALKTSLAMQQDRGAEELTRAEERYVRHMSEVVARERAAATALADAERAKEEAQGLREKLQAAEARIVEIEASLAEVFEADTASKQSQKTEDLVRSQVQGALEDLEKKHAALAAERANLEKQLEVARRAAAASAEELGREKAALAEVAGKLREAEEKASADVRKAGSELQDERAARAIERAALIEARDKAVRDKERENVERVAEAARAAREEALGRAAEEHGAQWKEAVARLRAELEAAHEVALAQARADADQRVKSARDAEAARASAFETQAAELSRALAESRERLDGERRERIEAEGEAMARVEALEAAAEAAAQQTAERSAELDAIRTQLSDARRQLDHEATAARAALEALDKDRTLLSQAKTVLSELVSQIDDDKEPQSREPRSRKAR